MGGEIEKRHHQTFESLKQTNDNAIEFWFARDLQPVLDYSSWDKFKRVILKAREACTNSGQPEADHFSRVVKMVRNPHYEVGAKVRQTIKDLGGTMPESLPNPEKSIKQLERGQKKSETEE
jgi:DNA-damage-inducible protein D